MNEAEWKQEAERMRENHAKLFEAHEKAVHEYGRLLKDYAALYDENKRAKANLIYAHAILDDAIRQFNEVSAELKLRMGKEM